MLLSGSGQFVTHFKPLVASSDGRFERKRSNYRTCLRNLIKLKTTIIRQEPNMENTGSTTWVKESGLIAQGIYYDAPG